MSKRSEFVRACLAHGISWNTIAIIAEGMRDLSEEKTEQMAGELLLKVEAGEITENQFSKSEPRV